MNKVLDGARSAAQYAEPYFDDAKYYTLRALRATKKEINKRKRKIKHRFLIARIKNAIEVVANITLIFAALIAVGTAILAYINNRK